MLGLLISFVLVFLVVREDGMIEIESETEILLFAFSALEYH